MKPDLMCIIVLEKRSIAIREAVQAIVRKHANGWWHHFPDVWIAGGHTPIFWRDRIQPIAQGQNNGVLILLLPSEDGDRRWAYFGPEAEERLSWVRQNYSN
jgi:hypothetical protein